MVRKIIKPDTASISFDIPNEFIGKDIEVIVFEKGEGFANFYPKQAVTFNAVSLDTRGFLFNRDEANG